MFTTKLLVCTMCVVVVGARLWHLQEFYKRSNKMYMNGFHWDTFSGGFGGFQTMRKKSGNKRTRIGPETEEFVTIVKFPFLVRLKKLLSSERLKTK